MTSPSNGTLTELYEQYMAALEADAEAQMALVVARNALAARPEYEAERQAVLFAQSARNESDAALAAVKLAAGAEFLATGDRQPHPYAGVQRIDRRAVYNEYRALQWVEQRPDYQHLVKPATLDKRGFEKLVRNLEDAGIVAYYDDDGVDVPVVEWDDIPVVAVRMRPDDV